MSDDLTTCPRCLAGTRSGEDIICGHCHAQEYVRGQRGLPLRNPMDFPVSPEDLGEDFARWVEWRREIDAQGALLEWKVDEMVRRHEQDDADRD